MREGKGFIFLAIFVAFFGLRSSLYSLTSKPDSKIILPEVIWAKASYGGTWVTEVQIWAAESYVKVGAYFHYGTDVRDIDDLITIPEDKSVLIPNILEYLQQRDPFPFNYYGKVGTLWLYVSQPQDGKILASARTVNGNCGKTFPGLNWIEDNCVVKGKTKYILDLRFDGTYRTFIGCFNALAGGYQLTAEFILIDSNGYALGSPFTKTFAPWEFKSFNPFVEAGLATPSPSYKNIRLMITVTYTASPAPVQTTGLMVFGSSSNNISNDTAAHFLVNSLGS